MGVIWDIILLAIIALCAFLAYRKGLIGTLFGLLGTVVAFVGAWMLSNPVGVWIDQSFVRAPVRNMVLSTLSGSPVLKYEEALANLDVAAQIRSMPEALQSLLSSEEIVAHASSISGNTLEAKNQLIDSIVNPISATISTAIAFVALFVVLLIACSLLSKVLTALCGLLPLGKKVNAIGGAICGGIKGCIIVLVVTAVLWGISLGSPKGFFGREGLETAVLTRSIIAINPICDIFR